MESYIDYYLIISSAIAGGIAGAIIGACGFKAKERSKFKNLGLVFGVLIFVTLSSVLKMESVKDFVMQKIDSDYIVKKKVLKRMNSLLEHQVIKDKLKTFSNANEANQYSRQLVHKGLKHLDNNDIFTWNLLRYKMAKQSRTICEGLWFGNIDTETLITALGKLPENEFNSWIDLSKKAALFEVDGQAKYDVKIEDFQKGIKEFLAKREEKDRNRLGQALMEGASASRKDGCWAVKEIMYSASLSNKDKVGDFLRMMSTF